MSTLRTVIRDCQRDNYWKIMQYLKTIDKVPKGAAFYIFAVSGLKATANGGEKVKKEYLVVKHRTVINPVLLRGMGFIGDSVYVEMVFVVSKPSKKAYTFEMGLDSRVKIR